MRYVKGEIYFPIIIALHLLLWVLDLWLFDGPFNLVEGESPIQRVLGEVMSSWVITVFGFNLLMATRARWVEKVFGGLDKMYVIHRRSGIVAAVLLLLHFGTVPRHPEFSIGKPLGFLAMFLILLGIFFAASPLMKRKLPYHKWLGGHRLMGPFYVVGVAHAFLVPTLIEKLPLIRSYVFGMALLGCGSWFYRAFLSKLWRRPVEYVVTRVTSSSAHTAAISMKPTGEALAFEAGQFAFFAFDQHSPREAHPFTIAAAPGQELRIVVKASGDCTSRLVEQVKTGETVRLEGPYGRLVQSADLGKKQIWFAGGIGITPFLAMAQNLDPSVEVTLYWSVRSEDEASFDSELKALAETNPRFEYHLWKSNERGFLSVDAAGGAAIATGKDAVICGPTALRDALTTQLRSLGTSASNIHNEEFTFR